MMVNILARILGFDDPEPEKTEKEVKEVQEKVETPKKYPTYDEMMKKVSDENGEE